MDTFTTFGLSDKAWNEISFLFPTRGTGRPRKHHPRAILDAILFIAKTGCQWNLLPPPFPPWKTVYNYFRQWSIGGIIEDVNELLRSKVRIALGKRAKPHPITHKMLSITV